MSIWCDVMQVAVSQAAASRDLAKFKARLGKEFPELSQEAIEAIFEQALIKHGDNLQQIGKFKQIVGNAVKQAHFDQQPALKKAATILNSTINLPRSLTTMGDLPVFRQGGVLSVSHPLTAIKNIRETIHAMRDEQVADAIDAQIKARASANMRDDAEVYIQPLDRHAPLESRQEEFMNTAAQRLPGIGAVARGSERGFATFLNLMRADTFDYFLNEYRHDHNGADPTLPELKAIGVYLNTATGRGDLGKLESVAPLLNTFLFSARYFPSRVQYLAGKALWDGTPESRKLLARAYVRYVRNVAVMTSLFAMAQKLHPDGKDKIEIFGGGDTRSSGFGNVRIGNTHFDLLSGLSQPITLASRLLTQKTYQRGRLVTLGKRTHGSPTKAPTGGDLVGRLGRGKLAPVPGLIASVLSNEEVPKNRQAPAWQGPQIGTDVVGEPVTPMSALAALTLPMSVKDVWEAGKMDGAGTGVAALAANLLSMNTATYPSAPKKK